MRTDTRGAILAENAEPCGVLTMDCKVGADPLDGVAVGGSIRSSRSSSTVGRNPVELKTDELQVVVDADDILSESGATIPCGSEIVFLKTV
jgi:hypothetical protein